MTVDRQSSAFLYRQVTDLIKASIADGTLQPGDRLPSLRKMGVRLGVSIPTVQQAYVELERQRRIESRPRSGYYVRHLVSTPLVRATRTNRARPSELKSLSLMERVYEGIHNPDLVPLGIANPCMAKPAAKSLHRTMKRIMARAEERSLGYSSTFGEQKLRRQIAYRYLDTTGARVDPEDICITNGGQEALLLSLSAVASSGDVIAVETPTYHGLLELIDSLGMLAVEVETCPEEGVTLAALEQTLERQPVKACIFASTLSNPLGATMPAGDRRRLVDLLARTGVPLIEDDVYGELHFDGSHHLPAQFLNQQAQALTCGSFSKTAAPGYRIGWVLTGGLRSRIARLKRSMSNSSGLLQQMALADFMASGDYSRHLRALRPVLQQNMERMSALIEEFFPPQTRTSRPVGGCVLWLELPKQVDSGELFDRALEHGVSIAPGPMFSPRGQYKNFVRLSFGHRWSQEIEDAVRWLGEQAQGMSEAPQVQKRPR